MIESVDIIEMMITTDPIMVSHALHRAQGVVIFAGAGMSAELGIPTYWSGASALYSSEKSKYGLTQLEHADARLWNKDPEVQSNYFSDLRDSSMDLIKKAGSENSYSKLSSFLHREAVPYFCVTSNIDNAFALNGFSENNLYEVHGSLGSSQCLAEPKNHGVFRSLAGERIALCPRCSGLARPNTLFFDDFDFNSSREVEQAGAYKTFLSRDMVGYVILEIGAGRTVPRIRDMSTRLHYERDLLYVHLNPAVDDRDASFMLKNNIFDLTTPTAPEIWVQSPSWNAMKML